MMDRLPTTVVKIGGSLIDDPSALAELLAGVGEASVNGPVVLVHGGGKQSTTLARRLGREPVMINGRRVTSDQDLIIALWTMRGELNAKLVAAANAAGIRAAGVSGIDAATVRVVKRPPWTIEGREVDFGHVGDVVEIEATLLELLLSRQILPIVASLGVDAAGAIYNVNADTVATEIARAVGAGRLLFIAESGGLRKRADDPASHLSTCSTSDFQRGVADGSIVDGMRVKLEVAFAAAESGIENVVIAGPSALRDPNGGTRIIPDHQTKR